MNLKKYRNNLKPRGISFSEKIYVCFCPAPGEPNHSRELCCIFCAWDYLKLGWNAHMAWSSCSSPLVLGHSPTQSTRSFPTSPSISTYFGRLWTWSSVDLAFQDLWEYYSTSSLLPQWSNPPPNPYHPQSIVKTLAFTLSDKESLWKVLSKDMPISDLHLKGLFWLLY